MYEKSPAEERNMVLVRLRVDAFLETICNSCFSCLGLDVHGTKSILEVTSRQAEITCRENMSVTVTRL